MAAYDSPLGHQLDEDTLCLYKMGETITGSFSTCNDEKGTTNLEVDGTPAITWGPAGKVRRSTFARNFFDQGNGTRFSKTAGTFDALRSAIVEGGVDHTWEFLLRSDIEDSVFREFVDISGTGESSAGDFIFRLGITQAATASIECFWERGGSNQQVALGTVPGFTSGDWHTIHFTREDRLGDTTKFTIKVYFDGVLVQTFDEDGDFNQGNGSKPNTTSGTSATLRIGNDWWGAIGSMRLTGRSMTLTEIEEASADLLLNGDIVDTDGDIIEADIVGHWRLNERPDLIDEANGFHMSSGQSRFRGSVSNTKCPPFDLVGSGGRALGSNNNSSRMYKWTDRLNFFRTYGRHLYQFFNDDVDTVPEYTIAGWFLYAAERPGATRYLAQWDASSESSATNFLFRFGLTSTYLSDFFAERGSGTNIGQTAAVQLLNDLETDASGIFHWAVVVNEDPDTPGVMQITNYINGVSKGTVETNTGVPSGGSSSTGILFGGWSGWVQDLKVSKVARTAQEILDDYNSQKRYNG